MSLSWQSQDFKILADNSPGVSSYTGDHEVKAVAQTFVVAHEIKSLTFTTSRTGITVKDLVCESRL